MKPEVKDASGGVMVNKNEKKSGKVCTLMFS